MKEITLKVTYDHKVDAVYIYFTDTRQGMAVSTYSLDDEGMTLAPDINIDTYNDSELLGMEILDASQHLPKAMLAKLKDSRV